MVSESISSFHIFCALMVLQVGYISCSDYCVNSTHFSLTFSSETRIIQTWFASCQSDGYYFNLSNNEIDIVKNTSFDIFWKVKTLDLSNNNISEIEPKAFLTMRSLEYLYLDHNELYELPLDFFDKKNSLVTVDLSFNKISHIPLPVFNYRMPKTVLLHHNRLTAFEPWAYLKEDTGERLLDLRYNNISTFTNDYNWTYESRTLEASTDLRNNLISKWHDWYFLQYKSPSAKDIGIEGVMVELLPDIRDNQLICDCNTHNMINRVRQSFIRWATSKNLAIECYNPPNLRGKRAFYDVTLTELVCNISQNCPTGCLCQDRPEHSILNVDCQGFNLTRMPETVPHRPYNKKLKYSSATTI